MNWFVNLPIRSKLVAGFAPFVLLLCVVIATACVAFESIPQRFSVALDLQNLRSKLNRERADLLATLSAHEPGDRDAALQDLKACALAGDVLLQRLRAARRVDKAFQSQIATDRKSTRLNSSHVKIAYAVFCLKKKTSVTGTNTVITRA